ncbi:divalent-cation tolerance protein CutA [Candidatus Omnitrophota bacterium]
MHIVVLVTAANKEEAQKISNGLIQEKLAACVNVIDGVNSIFWWEGKVDSAQETLLVIKTKQSLFEELEKKVKELHSYDCPEIIALSITAGNKAYLDWIDDSTKK